MVPTKSPPIRFGGTRSLQHQKGRANLLCMSILEKTFEGLNSRGTVHMYDDAMRRSTLESLINKEKILVSLFHFSLLPKILKRLKPLAEFIMLGLRHFRILCVCSCSPTTSMHICSLAIQYNSHCLIICR